MPEPLAPPLALPLTTSFPCRASPQGRAARHPVVIRADWSVDTGHDDDLERIAAALGGSASCPVELPVVLPLFARWWRRATRGDGLVVRSDDAGRSWHVVDGPGPCCPPGGFPAPAAAGAHAREVRHIAGADAQRRALHALVAGLGVRADPAPPGTCGVDADLVAEAWACGLAPEVLGPLVEALTSVGVPADLPTVLGLVQRGADPGWMVSTLAAVRAPARSAGEGLEHAADLPRWLAWSPTPLDVEEPGARAAWLATGARRADIVACSQAGYRAADARRVASGWGISAPGAAQLLARWVGIGARPEPEQLVALREAGLAFAPAPPSARAVARLAALLGGDAAAGTTTAMALAICREGTVQAAAAAWLRASGARRTA
jgi:hypothetical protein